MGAGLGQNRRVLVDGPAKSVGGCSSHCCCRSNRPQENIHALGSHRNQRTPKGPRRKRARPRPGMGPAEQDLACLHADALTLNFRLELSAGRREAAAASSARRAALLAATARRDAAGAVFGARTAAQRREDDARAERAGRVATNPAVRGRAGLLLGLGVSSRACTCGQSVCWGPPPTGQCALAFCGVWSLDLLPPASRDKVYKRRPPAAGKGAGAAAGLRFKPVSTRPAAGADGIAAARRGAAGGGAGGGPCKARLPGCASAAMRPLAIISAAASS